MGLNRKGCTEFGLAWTQHYVFKPTGFLSEIPEFQMCKLQNKPQNSIVYIYVCLYKQDMAPLTKQKEKKKKQYKA